MLVLFSEPRALARALSLPLSPSIVLSLAIYGVPRRPSGARTTSGYSVIIANGLHLVLNIQTVKLGPHSGFFVWGGRYVSTMWTLNHVCCAMLLIALHGACQF